MYKENHFKLITLALTFLGTVFYQNNLTAQIDALGECDTTVSNEYSINISGLEPDTSYVIIIDGDTLTTSPTGDTFPTGDSTYAGFTFVDGTEKKEVLVIRQALSFDPDTTKFTVNEVLCVDLDVDGTMDYNTNVCDYTKPIGEGGAIISTVAPFTGDNVYLYILTDGTGIYMTTDTSNNSGYFTDLVNGDYKVFAFNFLSQTESDDFLSAIPNATDLISYSVAAPACYALCGSADYTVDCESIVDIYVSPSDEMVCADEDAEFYVQDSFLVTPPVGATLTYQWQVNDGTGWANTADGTTPDSVLNLTAVTFADSGNMYRVIVTMDVGLTTISMDTSGVGTLEVYDNPVLLADLDVTVSSDTITGIVLGVTPTSVAADSFEIISIDVGTDLDADPGNATVGVTADTNYIFNDSYTNTGIGPDTAFYEVVPFTTSGCRGDTITIFVEVLPCPMVSDLPLVEVCSGEGTGISLLATDDNGLSIDSFVITASVGTNLGGTATMGTFTSLHLDTLQIDTFTNLSDVLDSVVYTITPYAYECAGTPFKAVVNVRPEPVFADVDFDQCSDVAIGHTLAFNDSSGLAIASVDITVSVGDSLTGSRVDGATILNVTTTDTIEMDSFTNISSITDSVVYTVTPTTADGCTGEPYTITVRILSEPVGSDPDLAVCSDENFSIDLSTLITNGGGSATFTWIGTDNPDVGGIETTSQSSSTLADQLSNTTSTDQTVTYTVVPTVGTCVGEPFDVTVTVHPEPEFTDMSLTVCSDEDILVDLSDSLQNGVGILGYTYTVTSTDPGTINPGPRTDTSDADIDTVFTNTTANAIMIVYNVTPITVDSCAGDPFDVTVTVDPEPELSSTLDDTVCSESSIGLDLDVESGSVAAESFNIISITPAGGLTGDPGNSTAPFTATASDTLSDEAWTNTTSGALDVVYSIAPVSAAGCIGDTLDVTITIDPEPVVSLDANATICSTDSLDLSGIAASITGATSTGTWSSNGTGTFKDATSTSSTAFGTAVVYVPSMDDMDAGTVTITLSSTGSAGSCPEDSETLELEILDIRCSTFPWDGND